MILYCIEIYKDYVSLDHIQSCPHTGCNWFCDYVLNIVRVKIDYKHSGLINIGFTKSISQTMSFGKLYLRLPKRQD